MRKTLTGMLLTVLMLSANAAWAEPQFDGTLALEHIVTKVSFGPREPNNPRAKQKTVSYIKQTLEPLADRIITQQFSRKGLPGTNIWASFNPVSEGNAERIMLGAHWDTRPQAEKDRNPALRNQPIAGANDGASGVAVLLELARVFAANPPPVTIDLVFFDLEDMGNINDLPYSIGASEFIAANPFYRPNAGIIIDMVCAKNLSIPREQYSQSLAGELMDTVWEIAKQQNSQVFKDRAGIRIMDDHVPFLSAGIKVIDLIHYPFPDHWHSSADTVDKCSSDSLQQVGDVVQQFVATYKP
ncbi:M28 family peptidase [bacterium]|nr:M28 family peptidase [bacterium]